MRLLAIFVLAILALNAQTPKKRRPSAQPKPAPSPESYELKEFPIATLNVEGNSVYPTSAILAVAGLKIGEPTNKDRFEAARDRLLATGAFDSVGYRYFNASDGKSYDAVFQIVESVPVYPFRFEDLGATPAEIETVLKSKDPLYGPKIPPTKQKIDVWTKLIQDLLASKKANASVVGKVEADAPEKLTVVFRPAGDAPKIADVRFTGNATVPTGMLKPAINGVAIGVPFKEDRFRQLLDTTIRPIYEARGRLNVQFPKIVAEPAAGVKGLDVLVTVEEGDVFQLGTVELQGPPALPKPELYRAADFKTADIANMTAVRDGAERIRNYLRRQGYLMTVVTPDRRPDTVNKKLNMVIDIDPGAQYSFRSLKIEGLDIESEPVIRKMWGLQQGKPYNPDYPNVFLRRVAEEGIFDNLGKTASKEAIDEAAKAVDVTLVFGAAAETKSILKGDRPKQ